MFLNFYIGNRIHLNFLYVNKKIIMYFGYKYNQPLQLVSPNMIIFVK